MSSTKNNFSVTFSDSVATALSFVLCLTDNRLPCDLSILKDSLEHDLECDMKLESEHLKMEDPEKRRAEHILKQISRAQAVMGGKVVREVHAEPAINRYDIAIGGDSGVLTRYVSIIFKDKTSISLMYFFERDDEGEEEWKFLSFTYKENKDSITIDLST